MGKNRGVTSCFYTPHGTPDGPSGDPTGDPIGDAAAPGEAGGGQALAERLLATPASAGPWSPDAQHGGPPAGLLARAVERLPAAADRVVGRFTMELLGPVPVGPLVCSAHLERPGRTVAMAAAVLHDPVTGRDVASARAWLFPRGTGPGEVGPSPGHGPGSGVRQEMPQGWLGGYLDAVEWRWIRGSIGEPGPGVVWMRPPQLVEGEETSPVARLLTCVDSASGASSMLDMREWGFLNTELTVHVLREPVGEWVCLDAETHLGPGSVGIATCTAYDELGPVARSSQALLVVPR